MILNLINKEKSDIKYHINEYPDGHKHIKLVDGFNKHQFVNVHCRIRNADDLFILLQINDILRMNDMTLHDLCIHYLFTARCDRNFSIGEAFDLRIVCSLLRPIARNIYIRDIHSDRVNQFLNINIRGNIKTLEKFDYKKYRLCFPDEGSVNKLKFNDPFTSCPITSHCVKVKPIICNKTRVKAGINELYIEIIERPKRNRKPILVVDDICDGGVTFVALAETLKESTLRYPELSLFVPHAIQLEGIKKVAKVYDNVFITNSFHDWQKEELPKNVKVIEVN